MPAKSKHQQRFFGMVHQCQKTGKCVSPEVKKVASTISYKDAEEFASTKHDGLPAKVKPKKKKKKSLKEIISYLGHWPTFNEWILMTKEKECCQCECELCKGGNCANCSCEDYNCGDAPARV
jgi:hypothetical protein